ncbi:hypothetical protein BJX65DRAFT_134795 [Aspergillus insuetus]
MCTYRTVDTRWLESGTWNPRIRLNRQAQQDFRFSLKPIFDVSLEDSLPPPQVQLKSSPTKNPHQPRFQRAAKPQSPRQAAMN